MDFSQLPDLTFGVEMEFMSPCPPSRQLWVRRGITAAARMNVAMQMAELTELPVACKCTHGDTEACAICDGAQHETCGSVRVLSGRDDDDEGVATVTRSKREHNYFLFMHEHLDGRAAINVNRDWPGVEMASPIFRVAEWTAGLPSLTTAVSALRAMEAEITADESCGLHVHIGMAGGMTLLLAKKITTLVMVLEASLLLDLVAFSRLGNESADPIHVESAMAKAIGKFRSSERDNFMDDHLPPIEAMQPQAWNRYDPDKFYDMFARVWSSKSLQLLSTLTSKGANNRCGFDIALRDHTGRYRSPGCEDSLEHSPTTVEFRYAQMSFDMPFIRNWIEVLFRIVQIANQSPDGFKQSLAAIFEVTARAAAQCQPTWDVIMGGVLGLGHRIPEWRDQQHLYHARREISHLNEDLLLMSEEAEALLADEQDDKFPGL